MVKLGLIGRTDARGIAWQTHDFWRHMQPDKVLAVQMNDPGWPEDFGRFGDKGVTFVDSNLSTDLTKRGLDESKCRKFLEGLDVVFAVETVYDWRLIDWAHDAGAKVVIQGNPEFAAHHRHPDWQHPDAWAWPTPWLRDELVELGYGNTDLPVPVEERDFTAADPEDDTLRIVHVVGKMAANDRNGTLEFIEAVAALRQRVDVRIVTQDATVPRKIRHHQNVDVEVITGGVADRWDLYEGMHMLVLPRKYAGLCLPAQEAMGCGLAVMMTDCSPNEIWPGPRIKARKGRIQRSPFGKIQTYGTHPIDIAQLIDRYARDRDRLIADMDEAQTWALNNNWTELKPRLYDPFLEGLT